MRTTQQRIQQLINENEARKASYPIAGSLVKFVSQTSQTFIRVGGGSAFITLRVKFTPLQPGPDGKSIIELNPQVSIQSDFSTLYPRLMSYNEPQSGDGSIIVRFSIQTPSSPTTYYIRVIANGSSLGTFEIL